MTQWNSIIFPNANSPVMEQMIFFHDHSMIILVLIIFLISYIFLNIFSNKFINLYLTQGQDIEFIWTVFPAILLLFIAFPSLRLLYFMEEMFSPNLSIKVIGHQWYWSYEINEFNINFDSFMLPSNELSKSGFRLLDTDNRITIPFNIFTRFLVTSSDVIHSWTVPSLGMKTDAIPGRLNQTSCIAKRPGIYFGQCSEICGANHSFMPISLQVTNLKNFSKWIKTF